MSRYVVDVTVASTNMNSPITRSEVRTHHTYSSSFLFLGVHKWHCVPTANEGWSWPPSPKNRCLWIHHTGNAKKKNTWQGVALPWHCLATKSAHVKICWRTTKSWWGYASVNENLMCLSLLVYEICIRYHMILLLVEILRDALQSRYSRLWFVCIFILRWSGALLLSYNVCVKRNPLFSKRFGRAGLELLSFGLVTVNKVWTVTN